jgi:hypothetical protein
MNNGVLSAHLKDTILSSIADLFSGMATAWALTLFYALTHLNLTNVFNSFILIIIFLSTAIGIRLKLSYDKHS